jgi:hypothetical protein
MRRRSNPFAEFAKGMVFRFEPSSGIRPSNSNPILVRRGARPQGIIPSRSAEMPGGASTPRLQAS